MADLRSDDRQRRGITVTGTWDIETEAWDTFVCACLYIEGQKPKVWSWKKEEACARALLALEPGDYWAHNGGRFDTLWLLGWAIKLEVPFNVSLSGSSVVTLTVGKVKFRDSARLIPMTLERAARMFGRECKREWDHAETRRGMSSGKLRLLIDYMIQDCRALHATLCDLEAYCEEHDLDLRPTLGASAWATASRWGAEDADWGARQLVTVDYRDARRAYFGGRTQVFRPQSAGGWHYDLNSAYPAALVSLELPVGTRARVAGPSAARILEHGRGLLRALVTVPATQHAPVLPVRAPGRLGFPVGSFEGWWTALELQHAVDTGTRIDAVVEGLEWDRSERVLAPLCQHVWNQREKAGPKTPLGVFLKLYANSLTGKLATKPIVERITHDPDAVLFCPADFDCQERLCGHVACCEHRCMGTCGRVVSMVPGVPIFTRELEQLSPCSQVHWAACLTAWTRVKLHAFMGAQEDLVYCDTDSLFCERERTQDIGPELGQWKLEDRYQFFTADAPKTYLYADEHGEAHGASKGIPDAVRNYHKLRVGVHVDRGVDTFKTALRKGKLFSRRSMTRAIRPDGLRFGDRYLGDDGRTYPPTADELLEGA